MGNFIPVVIREVPTVVESETKKYENQESIESVSGLEAALAGRIVSRPASGQKQVFSIVWDPNNKEFIIEVSETTQ